MGDRTTVYIDVRKDERNTFMNLLNNVVEYAIEFPDEEYDDKHSVSLTFYECNYGWDRELTLLSQDKTCPPFIAYSGEGGDYEPERYIFIGGILYSHVAGRDHDLIIAVGSDHIDYDVWGYTQLFLEVEREFQDYVKQYKEPA